MSGVYSSDFHEGITHLVAGVVASPKYQVSQVEKATSSGVTVTAVSVVTRRSLCHGKGWCFGKAQLADVRDKWLYPS